MNFRRSIIIAELWRPEVARLGKMPIVAFFLEKNSYRENWQLRFGCGPKEAQVQTYSPDGAHVPNDTLP